MGRAGAGMRSARCLLAVCLVLAWRAGVAAGSTKGSVSRTAVSQPVGVFGAGASDHNRRNAALLETLRHEHPLELRGVTAPSGPMRITDAAGRNSTCVFREMTLETLRQELMGGDKNDIPPPATFSEALDPLAGTCADFEAGWWTYRWCHRNEVTQFHREEDGGVGQVWSLGTFNDKRSVDAPLDSRKYHAHYFEGGQPCDETGTRRQTEVRFFCCDAPNEGLAAVQAVDEPQLCSYTLVLCSLFTCIDEHSTSSKPPLESMLATLQGACFTKTEHWWTYEFCFGHYLRQFHPDPRDASIQDPSYTLGKLPAKPPPKVVDANGQELQDELTQLRVQMEEYVPPDSGIKVAALPFTSLHAHATEPSKSYVLQRFTNGTKCELIGKNRTTDVKIYCLDVTQGDMGRRHVFGQVEEVATCHYEVEFRTTAVCDHPAFHTVKLPDVRVECLPDDPTHAAESQARVAAASRKSAAEERLLRSLQIKTQRATNHAKQRGGAKSPAASSKPTRPTARRAAQPSAKRSAAADAPPAKGKRRQGSQRRRPASATKRAARVQDSEPEFQNQLEEEDGDASSHIVGVSEDGEARPRTDVKVNNGARNTAKVNNGARNTAKVNNGARNTAKEVDEGAHHTAKEVDEGASTGLEVDEMEVLRMKERYQQFEKERRETVEEMRQRMVALEQQEQQAETTAETDEES